MSPFKKGSRFIRAFTRAAELDPDCAMVEAALEALGRKKEAAAARAKFKQTCASADTPITSSCICLPGK